MNKPVTLITGTRKGIGKSLVEYYVKKGHQVVGCSRSPVDWEMIGYEHFSLDVADEQAVKRMLVAIRKKYGKLDNLINNAGIASMNHILLTPKSTIMEILNTNVVGTFLFCREAAKLMKKNNYGRIVNFSTVATPLKLEGEAIYAASKAAVLNLTQVLARELAEFGITVNSVGPTPVDTDLIRGVPEEKMNALIARQAIVRKGTVEDVQNIVDFYLQSSSGFVTGQNLYMGGVS